MSSIILIITCLVSCCFCTTVKRPGLDDAPWTNLTIAMPARVPAKNDDYVCTSIRPSPGYVLAYHPTAHADRIHHILLYGCKEPFSKHKTWGCVGTVCAPGSQMRVMYAWARNAPPLHLPPNVGFPIGQPGSDVEYLVLQVHYAQPFAGSVWDYAGITMTVTPDRPLNLASIFLFYGSETIPPNTETKFENISCAYNGASDIHPIAFRTHTHGLGRVVSAFRYRRGDWTMIGKRNPQWPQMFQPIDDDVVIRRGDRMAAQCRFNSTGLMKDTHIGSTGADEMCNFYMMYYHSADVGNPFPMGEFCGSHGPSALFAEYPSEGSDLLPFNPELENEAHQSSIRFGNALTRTRRRGEYYGGGDGQYYEQPYYTDERTYSAKKPGPSTWQQTPPPPPCSDCVVEKGSWSSIDGHDMGQISGLSMCPVHKNHLFLFHRGPRSWEAKSFDDSHRLRDRSPIDQDTVFKIDISTSELRVLSSWGRGRFHMPHGITVDSKQNVWLTDVGSHQVFKFSQDGDDVKEQLVLGEKFVPGSDEKHFCKPAAVAVASDGSFYVADGYCNARIVKFSPDGQFLQSYGKRSSGPAAAPLGTFMLPHDVVMDEEGQRLYVADRENGRVQILGLDGTPLSQIRPPDGFLTVYGVDFNREREMVFMMPGKVPMSKSEKRIKAFAASAKTNQVSYAWAPEKTQFDRPHAVRVTSDGRYVFIAEISSPGTLWKFEIKREQNTVTLDNQHHKHESDEKDHQHSTAAASGTDSSAEPGVVARPSPKPAENEDKLVLERTSSATKTVLVAMAALALPVLCIAMICVCRRINKQGGFRRANMEASYYKGTKWWHTSAFKDRNGFQPLSTEDIDAADDLTTDESDQEDTLYPVRQNQSQLSA